MLKKNSKKWKQDMEELIPKELETSIVAKLEVIPIELHNSITYRSIFIGNSNHLKILFLFLILII